MQSSEPADPVRPTRELGRVSDAELAQALIARRPEAYPEAWLRFRPLVSSMTRRSFGFAPDGDDLVQEVFVSVFRRIHTLRNPLALRSFVSAVAARTLSHERRQRRARFVEASPEEQRVAQALRVNADPAAKHAFCSLEQLLGRLRRRERDAFLLRFVAGMNAAEVGERLRVSPSTARRCYVHAWEQVSLWAGRDPFLADYVRPAAS